MKRGKTGAVVDKRVRGDLTKNVAWRAPWEQNTQLKRNNSTAKWEKKEGRHPSREKKGKKKNPKHKKKRKHPTGLVPKHGRDFERKNWWPRRGKGQDSRP